jgi:multiple sugar transport system permease protein
MATTFEQAGPRSPVVESIRVDKISPGARLSGKIRAAVALAVAFIMLLPVIWIVLTAFKAQSDVTAIPPKLFFTPSLQGFVSLLMDTRILSEAESAEKRNSPNLGLLDRIALENGREINGPSQYAGQLTNSIIIAGVSTVLSVTLGLFSAYAFSRFRIPGSGDLLFFILSTRMLPPVVVTIPIFLMYRSIGLHDTHLGLIMLYTVFNLSFSVWLLKGFIDEIPREYEEAALVDGYTRLQAFVKTVLPQAATGIAATAVFCLIFAWNEYAFAVLLTSGVAQTMPPFIPFIIGEGGQDWPAVAAGTTLFIIPIVCFTILLRKHLLRGITFGAVRR